MADRSDDDRKEIRMAFNDAVNMTPAEISDWLDTEDSQSVGDTGGEGESTGHKSGRRIVEIKRKTVPDLTEADYDWMAKVTGYIHRHTAQGGPEDDKAQSAWRYSLMNWGHDPMK